MPEQFTPDVIAKFWQRVDRSDPDGCWLWSRKATPRGYGQFWYRRRDGRDAYIKAHRMAYLLVVGPLLDGLEICHTCDNRLCCRPDHLWQASHRENMADMRRKGRHHNGPNAPHKHGTVIDVTTGTGQIRGEQCARTKLTADQVREIRVRWANGGISQRQLWTEYGITRNALQMLLYRQSWKHID